MLTMICTLEPATGKYMIRPACELYRTLEQTINNVLRREYEKGIPTWLVERRLPSHHTVTPTDNIF
jgi:hypothetical protein